MARGQIIEVRGLDDLIARLDRASINMLNSQLMGEVGGYIIFSIQERTMKGRDVRGRTFTPYSPRYRLFRQRTGHPVDKVNLFYTGSMMSSMTMDQSDSQVRVFFMNTTDRSGTSNPMKAYFLNKDRRFFEISPEEQNKIVDLIRANAERLLEGRR